MTKPCIARWAHSPTDILLRRRALAASGLRHLPVHILGLQPGGVTHNCRVLEEHATLRRQTRPVY